MPTKAAIPGTLITLQDDATTGDGKVLGIPQGVHYHVFYITGATGVSAGAVSIETSDDPAYTGTWAPLVNHLATPTTNPVVVTADTKKIYTYIGELANVRARISTTISGGGDPGVTVTYRGSR